MGLGGSKGADVSSGVSDAIAKEKKRAWRWCKCAFGCDTLALVSFVVGIVLLVYFITSLTGTYDRTDVSEDVAKGLAYFGIALLILGFILLVVGVLFCVFLCVAYKRLKGRPDSKMNFEAKHYAPGTAPYPQQEWGDVPTPPGHQASAPTEQAGIRNPDAPVTANPDQITPEVR